MAYVVVYIYRIKQEGKRGTKIDTCLGNIILSFRRFGNWKRMPTKKNSAKRTIILAMI